MPVAEKHAHLINAIIDGDLEPTECPFCREDAYVHDEHGKRNICLECEHEVLDSYYSDCARLADFLRDNAIAAGRWPAIRLGPGHADASRQIPEEEVAA